MELERLRQGRRECSCHNKSPYKPSTSHNVAVSPNDESAKTISKFLDMLKAYQYFKWNADELECWINEKLQTYTNEDFKEVSNLQLKKQKHQEFEFEVTVHAETLSALDSTGEEMIGQGHFATDIIKNRLDELHALWERLMAIFREKSSVINLKLKFVQFLRQVDEILFWIRENETYVTSEDLGQDLEDVETLQKGFNEFTKDLENQESRVEDIYRKADELLKEKFPEDALVIEKFRQVREALERLKDLVRKRQEKLLEAYEIQCFFRDIDRAISWVNEKSIPLSIEDCGRDLASVQALQRKHEALERDLTASDEKIVRLGDEAKALAQKHPDSQDTIQGKYDELITAWDKLKSQAVGRRGKLEESFKMHRFSADWRDVSIWMDEMKTSILADDLAKDVVGAEAQVERHKEYTAEINSRADSFDTCMQEGQALLSVGHPCNEDIVAKLSTLERERASLMQLCEERREQLEQCMGLQYFYRDAEQSESWIGKQEALLEINDVGDSLDSVEALIRKHEDFEKSLLEQEEKMRQLDEFAAKLIESNHYAAAQVHEIQEGLQIRRNALKEKAQNRRQRLEDSHRYQMFDRDADEMQSWISGKLRNALDESYKDSTNLQTKVQKHQSFEAEIQANQSRVEDIKKTGQDLLNANHYNSPEIKVKIEQLDETWSHLVNAMGDKKKNLDQASRQQQFARNVEDVKLWLNDVEAQIASEDVGRDLNGVMNAQKRHNLLESDVAAHRERIDAFKVQADTLAAESHFDAPIIQEKQRQLAQRYHDLQIPLSQRREKLRDALPSDTSLQLEYGDYSELMKLLVDCCKDFKAHSLNQIESEMWHQFAESFTTGSVATHKDAFRLWVKDKNPVVEKYIGFIESYRDPFGVRARFESFVAVVNRSVSKKFQRLVNNAERLLTSLPWPSTFEKVNFLQPDFTSLDVVTFATAGIPVGTNIPNYDDVRQVDGFKNVSLDNVLSVRLEDPKPEFLRNEDKQMYVEHAESSFELQVGLHELMGYDSGKLFRRDCYGKRNFHTKTTEYVINGGPVKGWCEPGETYDSKFPNLPSAIDKCRAECVGIYLSDLPLVLEQFGLNTNCAQGDVPDVVYINWLSMIPSVVTSMEFYSPAENADDIGSWCQAHYCARYAILRVLIEADDSMGRTHKVVGEDDASDLCISLDPKRPLTVARSAIGEFLRKLQYYKGKTNAMYGYAFFQHYSQLLPKYLTDLLWHKWLRGYLLMLQTRSKWLDIKHNLQPDDLVLVNSADTQRGLWRKAIVKQMYYDQDGHVRTLCLKTSTQEVEQDIRSVRKVNVVIVRGEC
ncbi:unnamed protein product [Trichobilharzia szidati]|nr:unnamed protein product [Trichobilharzia szidati]